MREPMWRQIAEDVRQKIEAGELGSDGTPLPSELELRDSYEASRNTVRDAVKWLVTRGLVVTRPGQGTFVVQKIDPFVTTLSTDIKAPKDSIAYASEVMASSRIPRVSEPRIEIQLAVGLPAAELHLKHGAIVSRHQDRFIDGVPWSLQTTFYPMRFVEQGADLIIRAEDIPTGVVGYIEEKLGIKEVGWRDRFLVRPPDQTETNFFKLPDDGRIAVIETVRTGYGEGGGPIRVTVTTYPADRNQFVMTAGKVPAEAITRSITQGLGQQRTRPGE
jgi:GntR family transcriptional regulator